MLNKPSAKVESWQPTPEENAALTKFYSDFSQGSNFRSAYEDQWQENIDRTEARPFINDDGSSGVVLPIAKWIIEQKQATEMKAPPSFSYQPGEFPDDEEVAKILELVVKKHVWNLKYVDLNFKLDIANYYKDVLGTMYMYVGWRKIYRQIRKAKIKDGSVTQDQEELNEEGLKPELYYDDICVDLIMPQDVWLHPLALGVADSPWIIARKKFDLGTFKETFSDDKLFDNVEKVKAGGWSSVGGDQRVMTQRDFQDTQKDQVMVFDYWNKIIDQLLIVANGIVIYMGPNPFDHKELPFVDILDRYQLDTWIGEGEPQRIANIADAINAFVNISIDKEKRSASGLNLISENESDFDDVAMLFDPKSAYRVSDPRNAFVHYDMPGMSGSTDRMISMLMDYLIYATGVDFRQITDMNASTQATVAAIRREITQGRLNLNVRRNENRGYKRLGWLLMKVVQQYYPIPLIEQMAGKEAGELDYRKIRVEGMKIQEKPNRQGKFDKKSLTSKSSKEGDIGFFSARPEYIRSKGELVVRVVSESTFSASAELTKSKAAEAVQLAQTTMITDPATGQQSPLLSVKYFVEQWIKAMGYDSEKAFDVSNKSEDSTAKDEIAKLMGGGQPPRGAGMPSPQGPVPNPTQPPAMLTGGRSEAVQALKAELGGANSAR